MEVPLSYINSALGLDLDAPTVAQLLTKMQLSATPAGNSSSAVALSVPPTRSDILHACDVMEDVAIAYGFNNIPKRVSGTSLIPCIWLMATCMVASPTITAC